MNETDRLVLERHRLPALAVLGVGDELEIIIKGRVRRIEADHIDVTAYSGSSAFSVLEGEVYVEFTILDVDVK